MHSNFWDNVRRLIRDRKDGQKWLAEKAAVGRTFVNNGIARMSSPNVDSAYSIAKVLGTTVEELVDREAGGEYVRRLWGVEGAGFTLDERELLAVYRQLDQRDRDDLQGIAGMKLENAKKGGISSDSETA